MATPETQDSYQAHHTIAWLAFFLAIVSLIFAIIAYNRSSEPTNVPANTASLSVVNEATVVSQQRAVIAANRTRLSELRSDISAQANTNEVVQTLEEVRDNLEDIYSDAKASFQNDWSDIEQQFDLLEGQIQEKNPEAVTAFDALLSTLQKDIGNGTNQTTNQNTKSNQNTNTNRNR